jgi:antagonist of KipI
MSELRIERPGMLTTIQDRGRFGYQALGVSVAGPMDPWSARLANRLVGNPDGAALLEVTLIGPRFLVDRECRLAVSGAAFDLDIGARTVRTPCVEQVPAGEPVAFRERHAGARAYVAVDGGVVATPVLGSAATHVRSRMGGLNGGPLKAGDRVPLGPANPAAGGLRPLTAVGLLQGLASLEVLPGDAWGAWGAAAFRALCTGQFEVSPQSDRMGYRLLGNAEWPEELGALVSYPTAPGAIQLPPGGQPILLMADRQTMGGYASIAVLARASMPAAGQLAPGQPVRFSPTSWEGARAAHRRLEEALDAIASEVAG